MNASKLTRRELISGAAALATCAFFPRTTYAADPVVAARLPYGGTWEGLVGVVGGIPARNGSPSATIAPYSGSPAAINNAIAACPAEGHVLLQPGEFFLTGDILIAKSNVTLRGSVNANAVPTTIVHGSSAQIYSTGWDVANAGAYTNVNIVSGHSRGSQTITVSASPSARPTVGQIMIISAPQNAPTLDGGGGLRWHGANPFTQIVKVTGVSGNDISFAPAINADYLGAGGTCKISFRGTSATVSRSGVENISFRDGGGEYVKFQGTDECWAKNLKTYGVGTGTVHIYPYINFRTEIRHCDMSHMTDLTNSTYCIQPIHCSNLLIIDNHFHDCPNVMPTSPWSGSAFAYNYVNDLPYSPSNWLSQIVFAHGCHSHYNLYEGNWCATSYNDFSASGEQSHSRNTTWLRNRMRGYDATGPKTSNIQAFTTETHHDNITLAGNVLGENGVHTIYSGTSGAHVLEFDATSAATVDLVANYNTVNDAIPAAEALGGGEELVTSYLYSTKPSWFGNLPWPPITPTNFAQSNNSQNIPAGFRAANGADPSAAPAPGVVAGFGVTP